MRDSLPPSFSLNRHLKCLLWARRFLAVLCLLSLSSLADELEDQEKQQARETRISGRVADELIVRFKPAASESKKSAALKKAKGTARPLIAAKARTGSALEQIQVVKVAGNVDDARAALENDPDVLYVEPNFKTRVFAPVIPDDFEFESLYAFRNSGSNGGRANADIKAPEAWEITTGSRDVLVAVIDTGMDFYHEDLRGNMWTNTREIPGNGVDDDNNGYIDDVYGYDFISDDSSPFDDHLHGTHVGGTIGALGNNGIGVVGVSWNVRLMAIKAFNEQGNGSVSSAVAAIHYAIANGAKIINASWGLEDRSRALADAVAAADAAGIVFVGAAGNSRTATPFYPAGYESVIAVASTSNRDERSNFSNFGPHIDLSAPGEQILSTIPDSKYDFVSGTSMATPHVAGAAALILSRHPEFTPAQVAAILKNTTDPIASDRPIGRGRLNIFKALQINSPLPDAIIRAPSVVAGRIDFRGTASGVAFQKYTLAYGSGGQPSRWTEFHTSTNAVNDGVLAEGFDTSILNDGTYTFRVVVTDVHGQSASDVITVEVLNVQIAFPLSADILRANEPLLIRGTVFGQGRHFGLAWAKGLRPTEWTNTGFTIPNNGEALNTVLATFDTSQVPSNEFYSFRLSATNSSGAVQEFTSSFVWLDSRLRPGFPIYLPHDGEYAFEDWRQAKVEDLDGDGKKEIVIVDHGNSEGKIARLIVFRHDGSVLWSRELNGDAPYTDVPSIADMDGNGKMEIFVDVGTKLYAFAHDGSTLPGVWPITLNATRLGKTLADIDGDGKKEIVALANTAPENSGAVSLAVYSLEGATLQRWSLLSCGTTNFSQRSFPVVANMDADPELEIVIVSACSNISLFDMQSPAGSVWATPLMGAALNSPIVADVDHDGRNEIVVATWSQTKGSSGVYLLDGTGRPMPGWPTLTDDAFLTPPAVGDLDGDGVLEIALVGDRSFELHVLEYDGFEAFGWPVSVNTRSTSGTPTIFDIDGDRLPDVVLTSPGYTGLAISNNDPQQVGGISAWKSYGAPISLNAKRPTLAIPIEGSTAAGYFKASPVTATDLDGNGKLDLVAASIRDRTFVPAGQSATFKNRSTLYAWEFDVNSTNILPVWREFQRAPDNNGYLPTPKPPPLPPEIIPIGNQIVAIGQEFPRIPLDQFLFFPTEFIPGLRWSVSGQSQLTVVLDDQNFATITQPAPDWEGSETITFTVRNEPETFRRSIDVLFSARAGYIPPIAAPDIANTIEDEPVEIDVLANDRDPVANVLRLVGVTLPANGIASITPSGKISYVGLTNFFGVDTFSYIVENEAGASAFGSVTVHVAGINDPVSVNDDRALTFEDTAVTIDILANDKDPEGQTLQIVSLAAPSDGTAELNAQQKVVYTPRHGFNGTNVFSYTVTDGSVPQEGKITVIVRALNNAPVAKAQSLAMNRNTSLNITYLADDLEGDPLTFRIIKAPQHGELFSYPTVGNYTPIKGYSGSDSFSYKASDGLLESEEALVEITISATNNPPVPSPIRLMTRINQAVAITLSAVDFDDDPVSYRIVTQPQHGFLDGSGSNYVYTPHFNFLGEDKFTYEAFDGMDQSTNTITLETTDKNTAPAANMKLVKTLPNTPVSFQLTGGDAESNPLTFQLLTQPKHGTLTGAAPYLVYHPAQDYVGPDRLKFTVADAEFTSDPAPVTFTIAPKNTIPAGLNQTVIFRGDTAQLELNVRDADGDPLEVVILKGPRSGRLFGSGTFFTYTPGPNFTFADTFTYRAWDGRNFGNETVVRIEKSNNTNPTPPGFDAVKLSADGIAQITLTNRVGQRFKLESTQDFSAWTTLTNIESSTGRFIYTTPATNKQIFFRAIQ